MTVHTPRRAQVQIPQAISVLDYALGDLDDVTLQIGQLVIVPLLRKPRVGMVVGLTQDNRGIDQKALKPVSKILWHVPPLSSAHWAYLQWLGRYYLVDQGQSLRLAIPTRPEQIAPLLPALDYRRGQQPGKMTAAQQAIWDVLQDAPQSRSLIMARSQSTSTAFRQLVRKRAIESLARPPVQPIADLPILNTEQQQAFAALQPAIAAKCHRVALLQGATGSGKTEVYFHWIAEALKHQQQVLVLMPEVSLLGDWQARFARRFGMTPPAWHNGISPKQRREYWQQWARGDIPVLAGARSALHLPAPRLGLIIVDEEHDLSFKQEEGIVYNARDMAVVRGMNEAAVVVLASATPSLESLFNVERGQYQRMILPGRYAASLPEIALIDLNQDRPAAGCWLSETLIDALRDNLEQRQQSLLFLNRRGYAPLLLCRHCGHRFECRQCQSYLCQHQFPKPHLQCHHCGECYPVPEQCPACGSPDHLHRYGPGIERISEEVARRLPQARKFIATADTLRGQTAINTFLQDMHHQRIDIVIGTQIIAKGFDFPLLTLAGIVDTDQALWGSNPRAAEQTWQLLQQVTGRAGRHNLAGKALLQCHNPDDVLLQSLVNNDHQAFLEQQRILRQRLNIPPYGRLLAMVVQSRHIDHAQHTAQALADHAPRGEHKLLGPIAAPITKLRGWYRYRLLLMGKRETLLQPVAETMLQRTNIPRNVRVRCDVDPYHFH